MKEIDGRGEGTGEDRFARMAGNYDRWVGWEARLQKEMPFLLDSLPPSAAGVWEPAGSGGILDVGCGTGAHAIALAAAGYAVTGVDLSASMLEQARTSESASGLTDPGGRPIHVVWVLGDITEPALLAERWFRGVLALGNALLAFGEEAAVLRGLESMIRLLAPGGTLLLQYLNGTPIRAGGRLVVKEARGNGEDELWLRHHFEAGGDLYFHSYVLKKEAGSWAVEVKGDRLVDLTPEKILPVVKPHFDRVEFFEGLTGKPFQPETSDAVGVRASGRR